MCGFFLFPFLFSFLVSTHKSLYETVMICPLKPGVFPCPFPSLSGEAQWWPLVATWYPGGLWWVGQDGAQKDSSGSGGSDAFPGHHVPFLNLFSLPQPSQPHQPLTFC